MSAAATLKSLRQQADLTQQDLADKAGIDRSWLNQMERGKKRITPAPRGKLAAVLADELGLEATAVRLELGGGEDEAPDDYRPIHQRLEEVEAKVARIEKQAERGRRAVARRLAELEAALDSLKQGEARRQAGQ